MERGDGEMRMDPHLILVAPIGGALFRALAPQGEVAQTHVRSAGLDNVGVAGAATSTLTTLARGIWVLDLQVTTHFNGTSALDTFFTVELVENRAASPQAVTLLRAPHAGTNATLSHRLRYHLDLGETDDTGAGWFIRLGNGATIAGDTALLHASIVAQYVG